MRLTTISYLDGGPQLHTYVKLHILHFFSFENYTETNKLAAVAAHNKFAQYFFLSHSLCLLYIQSFQKRNKQQPSERFFYSTTVMVCIKVYMNELVKLYVESNCCCVSEIFFYVVVVVGWCHLKFFFFDII